MKLTARDLYFAIFSVALFSVMSGSLRSVFTYALGEQMYASQVLVVPFITAALFYMNRKNIFQTVNYSTLPGLMVMVPGVGLLVISTTTMARQLVEGDYLALLAAALVVLWLGGFLLFYGATAFRTGIFPLLFLVFFIPIPSPILDKTIDILRRGSADVAYVILKLSGTPILRNGFIFHLPDLSIEVAPECSGIRSGISLLITGLLAGHLFLRSTWKRGVLIAAAIPILIFKNALRISTLTYLAIHVDKRILTSALHREGGIPFFALGLLMLYPVLAMLIKSENRNPVPPGTTVVTPKPVILRGDI